MLTRDDWSEIAAAVSKEVEARSAASRFAYEALVRAVSVAVKKDLRPGLQDDLAGLIEELRDQGQDTDDLRGLIAAQLDAYVAALKS